jgi:general secretion pathway protein E/type IV pilus assembly protein PilB
MARLTDMGIEKYIVEAAVVGVVAQRLVRRVAGGRTAVYELLPGGSGRSLMANGRLKVKNGITTEEELARAIALEN